MDADGDDLLASLEVGAAAHHDIVAATTTRSAAGPSTESPSSHSPLPASAPPTTAGKAGKQRSSASTSRSRKQANPKAAASANSPVASSRRKSSASGKGTKGGSSGKRTSSKQNTVAAPSSRISLAAITAGGGADDSDIDIDAIEGDEEEQQIDVSNGFNNPTAALLAHQLGPHLQHSQMAAHYGLHAAHMVGAPMSLQHSIQQHPAQLMHSQALMTQSPPIMMMTTASHPSLDHAQQAYGLAMDQRIVPGALPSIPALGVPMDTYTAGQWNSHHMTHALKEEVMIDTVIQVRLDSIQPSFAPVLTVDLAKIALSDLRECSGLSKPVFSPFNDGRFICGTEEQDQVKRVSNNRLVFGRVDGDILDSNGLPQISSYPINDHVRDLDWLDSRRIVMALNQKLGIVVVNEQDLISEIILFPDFHTETIREIAVNPKNNSLVISGGFDGNVFVTNISRLVEDIQRNEKKSENSVYLCRDVVGSVSWHPNDCNVASCTTDIGVLHVFDIRTDQSKPAFVYDTGKIELYTHAYMDDFTVILGYGDGQIHVHDIRNGKGLVAFHDPFQQTIGEVCMSSTPNQFAVFGVGQVTVWRQSSNNIWLWGHHTLSQPQPGRNYKTSGEFVPGTPFLAATDSNGIFALYDLSTES